ncbi:hypothetical protein M406DRAFT_57574 [Cryphonectria parasitica EP155]|uniref:Uncharacterized protein n=1 Tax=Cryphonectria parasitica (strain ATCC 38755 / EP155) TaxID=660469 RepID=A0A9P5CKX9_CRYP1|nr:uncharacterized protein M406DRAFT_57574 [Cryphonectria parasitica EP155]KAF3761436.1 hypothetical protein M406DRAFT_57574 [Cryphonectria parasitica EP155]
MDCLVSQAYVVALPVKRQKRSTSFTGMSGMNKRHGATGLDVDIPIDSEVSRQTN